MKPDVGRLSLSRERTRVGLVALSWAIAACTPLLDRDPAQCRTDDDCAHFGGHPYCRDSVCVSSGLTPLNCFFATPANSPTKPEDFLNQCGTTALRGEVPGQCLAFPAVALPDAALNGPPTATSADAGRADAGLLSDGGIATYPKCSEVAMGNKPALYMTGSSNFPPLLEKLAPLILRNPNKERTPVFLTTNSCRGVRSMYNDLDHVMSNPPAGSPPDAYAQYYEVADDRTVSKPCMLDPGQEVDVGESETFPETCSLSTDSGRVHEVQGPNLAILFVVPTASQQQAISENAAHLVFGAGGFPPWNDPALIYVRGAGTATTQLVARAINVNPAKFWGIDQGTADRLAHNLQIVISFDPAQSAIGLLGADFYDRFRANLKALAYQDDHQDCAYTPDSNSNLQGGVRDKINVRNGHYPIWGPIHFFAQKTEGNIDSQAASDFVELFPLKYSTELLDAFIDSGWVPRCAMSVRRDTEVGPLLTDQPPYRCGCHFDARVNDGQTPPGCTTCSTPRDCTALDPKLTACNYGFCEVQ